MKINVFNNNDDLSNKLSSEIISLLNNSIELNGKASAVLCGGSTPRIFYSTLSKYDIKWNKVTVSTCDEHLINENSSERNDYHVRQVFLNDYAADSCFHSLTSIYSNKNKQSCLDDIDVLVLGLGINGHIASIFPDVENINNILHDNDYIYEVNSNSTKNKRITIGMQTILKAKNIYIHIVGQDKLDILLNSLCSNASEESPVKFLLRKYDHVKIFWAFE